MGKRVYSRATEEVMERFFLAMETCKERKLLKSYRRYCISNGITTNCFFLQRKDRNRGFFEISWAVPLIEECGVSAYWMLTGKGTMFAK